MSRPRAVWQEPPETAEPHPMPLSQALRVCGGSRLHSAQAPRLSPERLDGSPAPWPEPPQDEPAAARLRSPRPHLQHARRLSGREKPRLPWGLRTPPAPSGPRGGGQGWALPREGGHFCGAASGSESVQDGGAHGAILLVRGLGAAVCGPGQSGRAGEGWCRRPLLRAGGPGRGPELCREPKHERIERN